MEGLVLAAVVCDYQPGFQLVTLQVALVHVLRLVWHLFKPHWHHVVIVTVVDVAFAVILKPFLEARVGFVALEVPGAVLAALGLVEDAGSALHRAVLAQDHEPLQDVLVAREWPKYYLIKGRFEAKH